eukprot:378003-Rhodomonas_salina.2
MEAATATMEASTPPEWRPKVEAAAAKKEADLIGGARVGASSTKGHYQLAFVAKSVPHISTGQPRRTAPCGMAARLCSQTRTARRMSTGLRA